MSEWSPAERLRIWASATYKAHKAVCRSAVCSVDMCSFEAMTWLFGKKGLARKERPQQLLTQWEVPVEELGITGASFQDD